VVEERLRHRFEEATEGLHSIVIPEVKGGPGFVSGT
jgi:hypothetical protein